MPRTRAQAHAQEVESPLVSLDNAPRRRRRTTVASPTKSSADTQKATDTKLKRGRKPTKKATVVATAQTSEENTQNKSLVATAEAKENRLRAEKEAQAKAKAAQQAEEQQKPSPLQEQHEKLSAKQKGKKRTRDSNNDDIQADEAPRARRRRVTTSVARNARPGQTPGKRRTLTSIPGRNLSYSEMVRQRAMGREKIKAQPSMFQLDEAQLQEQERAAQAAEEAEEEEARNAITRAAMAPHMVSGPVPENLQSSFEVPVFEEEDEYDSEIEDADMTEPIQTPSSNNWGIRNFITSVTGSVRRRLVPFVRQAPDQAVPFAAGGDATPVQADGAANGPTNREAAPSTQINDTEATSAETNGTQNADAMDLTYSLFPRPPPPPPPPRPAQLSEEKAKADKKEDERGETAAIDKETVQVQETDQTNSNVANGEPQNADTRAEPDTGRNKRKRAPSPDVIPNPPGVSYGFDPDYFTYSDEEIEEAEEYCRREAEAAAAAAAAKPQVSTPTARPPEKRARFLPPEPEASNVQSTNTGIATTQPNWPPTPPGWARPTTTVYNGEMFKGMTHHQANHQAPGFPYYPPQDYQPVPRPLDSDHMHPMPKTYPSSGSLSDLRRVAVERRLKTRLHKARNHVNNLSGAPASLFPQSQPVQQPSIQAFAQQPVSQPAQPISQQISQQPLQQPISQPPREQSAQQIFPQQHAKAISSDVPPLEQTRDRSKSVIAKTNVTDETIHLPPIKPMSAAARGQPVTERSRPKTPSRLRNRIPLSSSPASQGSPAQAPFAAPQQNQEDLLQVFGDDEHGHRAYELFQSCPSGDLRKVQWPSFDPLPADDIQQTIRATPLSAEQQRINREMFQRSLEQFENELDQGLVDPEEILGDLPL